jgi:hypothetical protein
MILLIIEASLATTEVSAGAVAKADQNYEKLGENMSGRLRQVGRCKVRLAEV